MGIISILMGNKNLVIGLILIGLILIALTAGAGVYIKILKAELATAEAEKVALTTELGVSNNSIKTLQGSIDQQNAAVDRLKSAADARVQSHAVEIAAATAKANTYRQQALDILKIMPTTDKCKSADDLINSEISKDGKK